MDKKLQIVQHLYAEAVDGPTLRDLLEDEAVRTDYEALSAAKFALDHRPSVRPDEQVLDRIMAAAGAGELPAPAAPRRFWRADRASAPRRARSRRSLHVFVAAAVVVVAVGIGLMQMQPWTTQPSSLSSATARSAEADLHPSDEPLALQKAAPAPQAESLADVRAQRLGAATPALANAPAAGEAAVLAWDEADDDLLRMSRRIQALQQSNEALNWDEVAVPLEQLPGGAGTVWTGTGSRIRAAGSRPSRQREHR